jgi:hypothetical protein
MKKSAPPLKASASLLASLAVAIPARADLNSEVNDMFNDLGAIGNYTAQGIAVSVRGMAVSPARRYTVKAYGIPSSAPSHTVGFHWFIPDRTGQEKGQNPCFS